MTLRRACREDLVGERAGRAYKLRRICSPAGDLLVGTGGIRKVRFARGGRGKSGGVRVIYYFYTAEKPIYLLEIFGKNEKANLTAAQRNALAQVAAEIKQQLQRRQR